MGKKKGEKKPSLDTCLRLEMDCFTVVRCLALCPSVPPTHCELMRERAREGGRQSDGEGERKRDWRFGLISQTQLNNSFDLKGLALPLLSQSEPIQLYLARSFRPSAVASLAPHRTTYAACSNAPECRGHSPCSLLPGTIRLMD